MNDSLEVLLGRLNSGDQSVVEQMFVAFEPYMRMVIRRRISGPLRAKFDSADIVQSVWADFVRGLQQSKWTFENLDQLRAFLVKMTRNRFVDRLRKHRESLRREIALIDETVDLAPVDPNPRVSEDFYAGELWQQMLASCPPAHYELLMLKRQGATIGQIAERTKLHEGSVRRILYDIARRVTRLQQSAAVSNQSPR